MEKKKVGKGTILVECTIIAIIFVLLAVASNQGYLFASCFIGFVLVAGLVLYFNKQILSGDISELSNTEEELKTNKKFTQIIQSLAQGDTSIEITNGLENSEELTYLEEITQALQTLDSEFKKADAALVERNFNTKVDTSSLTGIYKTIAENVNQIIEKQSEKLNLYLGILDALPYRVTVMDNDMKIIFFNKILEDLMKQVGFINNTREEFFNRPCSDTGLEMCNTENCGIRRLTERNLMEYPFEFQDNYYRMDTQEVKDQNGKRLGYVEISHDTTPTMSVNVYTKEEVSRLEGNLKQLAQGDLNFNLEIKQTNEYTEEIAQQFTTINNSLTDVKESIGLLIDDATALTNSAIEGNLDERRDESKFNGKWQDLIQGMNRILEEIAKPSNAILEVMEEVAQGNLKVQIDGDYQGIFAELQQSVNQTIEGLMMVANDITSLTTQISQGDLRFNVDSHNDYLGDFAPVSQSIHVIFNSLNRLIKDINISAEQVNAGASQVSSASQSLAQGSTEQASSIQELTASIEEIAGRTKKNASDANQAQKLTAEVMENAEKGNNQMNQMQQSMDAINQSSNDISKIIKVIDDIAFQTNILALNAAVEAARAGEHGKGFAVVAEEVRTLAARSADAAKQTTSLIEGSIEKVQEGTKIADGTANALQEIVEGIEKVSVLTENIAAATNEQATEITQINTGIEQVSHVVQQNSATAEESAAASEELSSQAALLQSNIDQFKLRY